MPSNKLLSPRDLLELLTLPQVAAILRSCGYCGDDATLVGDSCTYTGAHTIGPHVVAMFRTTFTGDDGEKHYGGVAVAYHTTFQAFEAEYTGTAVPVSSRPMPL